MQLGTTPWLPHKSATAADLAAQAQQAEALGFTSFWLPEGHFRQQAFPEPLMALAAVATATRNIQLATSSLLLTIRNPLQLAEQVAVLDQLSKGRVLLGVGRGFAPDMLKAFGVEPGTKRQLFEKNLDAMRRFWAGDSITSMDAAAKQTTLLLEPRPYQLPHPPIWVAAFGPKALAQAGRLGLPYLASPVESLEQLQQNYEIHAEATREAGHTDQVVTPVMRTVCIVNSTSERTQILKRLGSNNRRRGPAENGKPPEQWAIVGCANEVSDTLADYRKALGMTHLILTGFGFSARESAALEYTVERLPGLVG